MKKAFGGIVLDIAFRIIVPLSLVYGVYVLAFGEYGPGGGFQSGALLAIGIVLGRLIMGAEETKFNVSVQDALVLAGLGTFFYVFVGWLSIFNGGNFLEYSLLPFSASAPHDLHALGILLVEIGVTVCVMMTIVNILDAVVERGDQEDGSTK